MGMLMHRHYLENKGATEKVAPEKVVENKVEEKPKKENKPTTKK